MRAAAANPFPAILDFMKQNMQRLEVGEGAVESRKQQESRAKRLLQLLAEAGWTRDDIDNSSLAQVKAVLEAAAARRDISEGYVDTIMATARKYGRGIGYFQG